MGLNRMEDFMNLLSKNVYNITTKDRIAYLMRSLIYDAAFKPNEKITQEMAWISFSNLLPNFNVKE